MIILKHQLYRNLKRFGVKNLNEQIENKTWTDFRSSEKETYSHDYKKLKPDFKF